jgi:bifunctional NMN adenylyltransferase/nudix hydrolase
MRPDYGVIVGRFQVNDLHDGHMELFRQVRARHSVVIVFVGLNPGGLSQNDPLDYAARRAMIQAKFPDFIVLPLPDCRTDEEWSHSLDTVIGSVIGPGTATLYGGRNSFVPHYSGKLSPVELAMPLETMKITGTDIRKEFSNKVIESPEFRAGMIYAAYHRWPEVLPCVDVAVFSSDESELLLGQKTGESQWRFIGGHYEKKHGSFEAAAKAEVMEETGLDLISLEYVGSSNIDDWRYNASPDHNLATVFYKGRSMTKGGKAKDDVAQVRWFKFDTLTENDLIPEHRVLFATLKGKAIHAATAK